LGLLLAVRVLTADIQDRDGAEPVLTQAIAKCPTLKKLWVDAAYRGPCADRLRKRFQLEVEVVLRSDDRSQGVWCSDALPQSPEKPGFKVLPRRWVIERTNGWNDRCRRLAKDYEQLTQVSEAWIWLAQAGILLRRLASHRPRDADDTS
jgi:transposase